MISRASSVWSLRAALALWALSFAACSEEPRSVAGDCDDIPLYRQVYDEATDSWNRVAVDGGPLSAEENERIDAELNRSGPRCLTPVGPSSSGGASSTDASSGGGATDASSGGADASSGGNATDASPDAPSAD